MFTGYHSFDKSLANTILHINVATTMNISCGDCVYSYITATKTHPDFNPDAIILENEGYGYVGAVCGLQILDPNNDLISVSFPVAKIHFAKMETEDGGCVWFDPVFTKKRPFYICLSGYTPNRTDIHIQSKADCELKVRLIHISLPQLILKHIHEKTLVSFTAGGNAFMFGDSFMIRHREQEYFNPDLRLIDDPSEENEEGCRFAYKHDKGPTVLATRVLDYNTYRIFKLPLKHNNPDLEN